MATGSSTDGTLESWYRDRIGRPSSDEEIRGYWLFVAGLFLGIVGIVLVLPSESTSALRQWALVIAAVGLALVFAGPIVRLPLRRRATLLVYLGLVVCAAAIVWFVVAFPAEWSPETGQPAIVSLYSLGLLLMGLGGVFVPLLTARAEAEDERVALRSEVESLRETLLETEADEAELSETVTDLREAVAASEADATDLRAVVDRLRDDLAASEADATEQRETAGDLRAELADAEADEADLAARLRALRASQARFELYEDRGGEYRWRLRHRNGNLIANGGEGYTRRHDALRGVQSVRRNALGGELMHVESESALPPAGEAFEPLEAADSHAAFELYEDQGGEFRFRLRHGNGNILADSGEGYGSRGSARTAIDRIREYVGPAAYLRFDPVGFEVYRDRAGQWRWRLVHRNGNVLADSGGGYSRRRDARRAIDRIQENLDEMEIETYEDNAGEFRWRLRSPNNRLVGDSGEGYASRDGVEDAVDRLREYAPAADVLDVDSAAFELYEDNAGEFRWRLRHRNGNVLADSGEGYADRSGARDGIERVKRHAPNAETEEQE